MVVGKEGKIVKKDFLFLFGALVMLGVMVFAFAAWEPLLQSPKPNGNYSGSLNLSCFSALENPVNASFYYNASGGNATVLLFTIRNISANQTVFKNFTAENIYVASLASSRNYNFTCVMSNMTLGINAFSVNVSNLVIDNTPPNVSNFYTTVNNDYVNGTMTLNVSVNDSIMGLESLIVRFNITYVNGTQVNFTNSTTDGTGHYTASINTTMLADGIYNVTVYANETNLKNATGSVVTNLNKSERIQITVDDTIPTLTYTCTPNTTVGQIVTCTCSGSDATAGINYTYDGTTTSNTASVVTYITARSVGTFSRTCTATDRAGNIAATVTAVYKITSDTGGSSSGSSTPSTFTYSKTIAQTSEDLSTLNTIETSSFSGGGLGAKEKVTFKVNNKEHYLGIRSLTTNSATIEIASDPVQISLGIGVETKQDLDGDGFYDITVKLNSITNGKADLTITYIHESTTSATTPTGEETPVTTGEKTSSAGEIPAWVWIVIGLIILAAIIGGGVILGKKKRR